MSAIIKQLTDKEDANDLLPITNTKAVYDDAGNRLDNTLTNLTNLVNNKASANLVSDAYNPSKTYARSEFCIYNNTLWKSKVDNNAGNTPAEGSYWTATNVGNEIKTVRPNVTFQSLEVIQATPEVVRSGNVVVVSGVLKFSDATPNQNYILSNNMPLSVVSCFTNISNEYGQQGVCTVEIYGNTLSARCSHPTNFYYFNLTYITQ